MPVARKLLGSLLLVTPTLVAGLPATAIAAPDPADMPTPTGGPASAADPVVAGVANALGVSEQAATVRLAQQDAAHRVAEALPAAVTGKLAGKWFDSKTGQLVVAVTDQAAARAAAAAGARPTVVTRSQTDLDRLRKQVAQLAAKGAPGLVSYGIDVVHNRVRVTVAPDRSVATRQFVTQAGTLGAGVAVEQVASKPNLHGGRLQPGSAWWPTDNPTRPEGHCSVGFGAKDAQGGKHFLTAGHCTNEADEPAWGNADDTNRIGTANVGGTSREYSIEGDFGLVAVTEPNWLLLPFVHTGGRPVIRVAGTAEALVGEVACQSGATAPIWSCNTVRALNQAYDFGTGITIGGLTVADGCAQHGDSGGPWLKGDKAVGLHVGGWEEGECGPGVDGTIFNPVIEALAKWNLTLVTESTA